MDIAGNPLAAMRSGILDFGLARPTVGGISPRRWAVETGKYAVPARYSDLTDFAKIYLSDCHIVWVIGQSSLRDAQLNEIPSVFFPLLPFPN